MPQDGAVGRFQLAMLTGSASKRATHLADSRGNQSNIAKGAGRIGHLSSESVSQSIVLSSAEGISASLVFGSAALFFCFARCGIHPKCVAAIKTEIGLKIQYSKNVIRS